MKRTIGILICAFSLLLFSSIAAPPRAESHFHMGITNVDYVTTQSIDQIQPTLNFAMIESVTAMTTQVILGYGQPVINDKTNESYGRKVDNPVDYGLPTEASFISLSVSTKCKMQSNKPSTVRYLICTAGENNA